MTIDDVRRAMQRPLPGLEAQARMAPPYRRDLIAVMLNPPACKQAGVLVLLYPLDGQLRFSADPAAGQRRVSQGANQPAGRLAGKRRVVLPDRAARGTRRNRRRCRLPSR